MNCYTFVVYESISKSNQFIYLFCLYKGVKCEGLACFCIFKGKVITALGLYVLGTRKCVLRKRGGGAG